MRRNWHVSSLFSRAPAYRYGVLCGAVFGLIGVIPSLAINLGNLDAATNNLVSLAMLSVMLVLFCVAGCLASRSTGRIGTGTRAGLWSGFVGSILAGATILAITFAFMDIVRRDELIMGDFARSGMRDIETFIVHDAIGGSVVLLVLALALGAGVGTIGGALGRAVRSTRH